MQWEKIGLIFCPNNEYAWMHTHAAVPIAEQLDGDVYKIYFSSRDVHGRSYTTYIVINILNPKKILEISSAPILSPGKLGSFDEDGAMGSWLTKNNDENFLYYIGWNRANSVPFRNSIGLSSSHFGSFHKLGPGPILDRTKDEPFFCASSCVIKEGPLWRMWYLSCTDWLEEKSKIKHKYHIKYAESSDGIQWDRRGHVAIDFLNESEYAISRPSVIKDQNIWKMWYSYRGDFYKIGYAESLDGITWSRIDKQLGLEPSNTGWDSEMVEYPFVFQHHGTYYMLYNGNDYGRSGFGCALLK